MASPLHTWWQRNGLLAGLFAPPALWVAVRWWLDFQLERSGITLPPVLSPASDPDQTLRWVWVGVAVACALGVLVWWLMRPATAQANPQAATRHRVWVGRVLLVLWCALWLVGAAQAVRSQLNRLGLQPAQEVVMKVVAVQVKAPSLRSVGGAKVYLDWPEGGGLHTVQLESPSEDLLRKPPTLVLSVAAGRWWGAFATGWRVDNAPAAAAPGAAPVAAPTLPKTAP